MSTIEQPPFERQPIETYVLEYDEGIVSEAIRKELARGGQVYYLHNRVDNIEECAARVGKLVPGARIGIAHGKMTEEQISSVWQQLLDNEIDILVCTTLIETGVDVRNCNTLIIENADRMGLSQLYQIRGRVGRSSRKAYAYFTFTRDKVLTEIAAKRLSAIREFTSFGRLPHCDARLADPRCGQSFGPQPARPHGGRRLRFVREDAGSGHCRGPRRGPRPRQERLPGGHHRGRIPAGGIYPGRCRAHRGIQAHCSHRDDERRRGRARRADRPLRQPPKSVQGWWTSPSCA